MTTPLTDPFVQRSLDSLKDFQRATVDVVYDNLFKTGQQRMLVADEVGLGKTIVAKGVIARRIMERLNSGRSDPLKVTYICSNQVIAHENVGKLDIYPNQQSYDRFASRLTYLALQPEADDSQRCLRLNTLTPATSFNKGSSTGQQDERKLLYSLLMHDNELSQHATALAIMLRAGVTRDAHIWAENIEQERTDWINDRLRADCPHRFLEAVKKKRLAYSDSALFESLATYSSITLYDAIVTFAKLLTKRNLEKHRAGSDHLVRELKDSLSELCVDYIDADLYILDEFQRFKELVDHESTSDAADIARRIFNKKRKILLLSATPFKAYTGDTPWESGEEHYKEFRTILRFLFSEDTEALNRYEMHRQALFKQLLELNPETKDIDTDHRDAVQQVLRRVMCRTERLSVSEDFNAMTVDKWHSHPLQVSAGDVQNFVATDNVVRFLNDTETNPARHLHAPVEFCKSAPFPLSFLDDYKLKHQLRARKRERAVQKQLRSNRSAWINHKSVHRYKLTLEPSSGDLTENAKLSQVMQEVLEPNGERLLWVPPSLPCYPLAGAFADSMGFSKTLIFSAWLMVPRMLSSLISYEVERRTIGNPETVDPQEKDARKYFHGKNEKRHPIPQLVFSQKRGEEGETANNMSNFVLLYPSQTLTEAFDPVDCLVNRRSIGDVRHEVTSRINRLIEEANLQRFGRPDGEADRWYWAAPLLLDRTIPSLRNQVKQWLRSNALRLTSSFFDQKTQESSSKEKHFEEFMECFANPIEAGLGLMPQDLGEVLADMAIASPATTLMRSVSQHCDTHFEERTTFAFDVANELLTLFNKPESIAAVRLGTKRPPYWRRVIQYCVDGCFQSVIDEFCHVVKADCPTLADLKTRLVDSMSLGTASIKVDDLNGFLKNKRRNMRCHYAVDMGNQRIETDEGKKRIRGIRQNFNSPFRPFVLATTSIGQEGLDFHSYCRKIVHWNLPTNPIDLEQREGRINRFKGLVIRQQIASKYRDYLGTESPGNRDIWDALFKIAERHEREDTGKCELIPFWHVEADRFQIERIIPFYPFSRDRARLSSLLKTLALYRLAFGQPRQAELVEHLLKNIPESAIKEIRERLMVDLSPITYLDEERRAVSCPEV